MKNALLRFTKAVAAVAMLIGSYLLLLYFVGGGFIAMEDYLLAGVMLFGGLGVFLLVVFKSSLPHAGRAQQRILAVLGWAIAIGGILFLFSWLTGGNLLHQVLGIYFAIWGSVLILFNSFFHPSRLGTAPTNSQG
ncbi:MAG: hypothetical protein JJU06_03570 [Ectothiorhodospiraceae bacterium]|nr:hypothetical protein [Ectothiorhodospiraceae bacterium]MCH8504307.1 hypothetical protein [Ectothiorhodospiraceae bacterium]